MIQHRPQSKRRTRISNRESVAFATARHWHGSCPFSEYYHFPGVVDECLELLKQDRNPAAWPEKRRRYVLMARYGKKAQQKVKRAMHERKRGKLKSGRSGKTVKSRKQAIAIGLSEARRAGGKVPRRKSKKK
jgi:uncharacterized protein DUF6496